MFRHSSPFEEKGKSKLKAEQLTPKQVATITDSIIDSTSHTSSIQRTFQCEDPSQIRCYKCNKIGHIAKNCHHRKRI